MGVLAKVEAAEFLRRRVSARAWTGMAVLPPVAALLHARIAIALRTLPWHARPPFFATRPLSVVRVRALA